jgi:hypothetical protein
MKLRSIAVALALSVFSVPAMAADNPTMWGLGYASTTCAEWSNYRRTSNQPNITGIENWLSIVLLPLHSDLQFQPPLILW